MKLKIELEFCQSITRLHILHDSALKNRKKHFGEDLMAALKAVFFSTVVAEWVGIIKIIFFSLKTEFAIEIVHFFNLLI